MVAMAFADPLKGPLSHVDISDIGPGVENAGARLRRFREASGWSLEPLAQAVGIALSTLRFWETEPGRLKKSRHADTVAKIARELGTTPLRIWYGDVDPGTIEEPVYDSVDSNELIAAFLARLAIRKDLPRELRDESLGLLSKLSE